MRVGPGFEAADWGAQLSRELGEPVEVRFGRARRQVLVYRPARRAGEPSRLQMNAFFRDAPPDIRHAVSRWLAVGRRARKASAQLDAWIAERSRELPPRRLPAPEPRGQVHHLDELVRHVLPHLPELDRAPLPDITWGRRGRRRAKNSLQLGSFDPEARRVRVHPVLDQAAVPAWFVRFVLFHELLHAALPIERSTNGRLLHHGPTFRAREASYQDAARALRWERSNLPRLLRSASSGRPIAVIRPVGWLFG